MYFTLEVHDMAVHSLFCGLGLPIVFYNIFVAIGTHEDARRRQPAAAKLHLHVAPMPQAMYRKLERQPEASSLYWSLSPQTQIC